MKLRKTCYMNGSTQNLKATDGAAGQRQELDILGTVTLLALVPGAVKECQVKLPPSI